MAAGSMSSRHPQLAGAQQEPVDSFGVARRHRAELLSAIHSFERALAVPAADPGWRAGVEGKLTSLRHAFAEHIEITEGPCGLYAELLDDAPRLTHQVHTLVREHSGVLEALDALAIRLDAEPKRLRTWANNLLRELSRHRQRGADLVYEAYTADIGGEN
jgi:hypothetical protein